MALSHMLEMPIFESAHRSVESNVAEWCRKNLNAKSAEHHEQLAQTYVTKLGAGEILRYVVPRAYSGAFERLEVRALCICRQTLAFHDGLADFSFAMQGLGGGPIVLFGSEQQKKEYLPEIANGKKIAAFALSELEAGSDVAAISCSAELKDNHFILNGTKSWISNAGIADFYVVFARTQPNSGAKGLSAFIVPSNTHGLKIIERPEITSPHPVGTLEFKNCKIPASNLISEIGMGFKVAMATLDVFRSTVGAAALGLAQRALFETLKHVTTRKTFGKLLCEHQMTQARLADMATQIEAAELLVYRAAWKKDSGAERITREAAMAKLYATEIAQQVIDSAMQLLGARAVVRDSVLERLYRDIRPLRIYEGTSEIQKIIISTQLVRDFEEVKGR